MRVLISFLMLVCIKWWTQIFFKIEVKWLSEQQDFDKIRLIAMLNHTSLYEPMWVAVCPYWFLWRLSRKLVIPVADKTTKRPIVGRFFRFLLPGIISITRKRDGSWKRFLEAIKNRGVIFILPEGRMKRQNGLDAYGKPMDVKSGITDILVELNEGNILFAYSGGLHHVQHPGDWRPKLFKTIRINLEIMDIPTYKSQFKGDGVRFKREIVADLNHRLATRCPQPIENT